MVNPNADPKPMSSLAALVSVAFVFVAVACTWPGTGELHRDGRHLDPAQEAPAR